MDETKENNTSLPAPTVDVKIRTMNSDMQSMGLGGGVPQMNVQQISTIDLNPAPQIQQVVRPESSTGSKKILYIVMSVVGIVVLFILGFFLPKLLFKNQPTTTTPPVAQTGKATTTPIVPPTQPKPTTFTHSTFFKNSGGGTIAVSLSSDSLAEGVSGAIRQQTAPISASFSEITFSKDGTALTWKEFSALYGLNFLPEAFFTENFKDDFTSFIYKDGIGTFPGYILQLKPDSSIVLLRSQLLKIEGDSAAVAKVFLSAPSNPEASFKDAQISNQPVRTLKFGSGETFYYGWFNNEYLVFATSEEGLRQAFAKL